jgi:Xaa-Pro aminopeptidase
MDAVKKLQRAFPRGIDAAIILSEHNRRYLTGFPATDGILFVTPSRAVLIMDSRYIEAAKAGARGCEVALLTDRGEQLRALAAECGVKTAGVEARELPLAEFGALSRELPQVTLDRSCALSDAVSRLRMIKEPEETELIAKAQELTDAAYSHILPFIKPGVAERDLALEIEFFMRKNGASGPSFDLIVVSGEKTSLPHGVPGDRKIGSGEFLTMDTGAIFGGYCSDMTRTVAVGGASPAMRHVYDTVLRAQLAAEAAMKPGVRCDAVDKVARDIIYSAGYEGCFGHGLGHSVGLQIHEQPRLSPTCSDVLEEGMLMTVEPGIYLEGRFGVRIEDLVVVTHDGINILTRSPKELTVL